MTRKWTIGFLFDDNDLLESVEGPDGTRLIERDADGWVMATVDPDGTRTELRRNAAGRIIGADPGIADDRDSNLDERDRARSSDDRPRRHGLPL